MHKHKNCFTVLFPKHCIAHSRYKIITENISKHIKKHINTMRFKKHDNKYNVVCLNLFKDIKTARE